MDARRRALRRAARVGRCRPELLRKTGLAALAKSDQSMTTSEGENNDC